MRHRVSSFMNLQFHPRSRISSLVAVSSLPCASGSGIVTAPLARQYKDGSPQDAAHNARAQRGLLPGSTLEPAVPGRGGTVPVMTGVLAPGSGRRRIGRGRLCLLRRGNSEHPPEDVSLIRGVYSKGRF